MVKGIGGSAGYGVGKVVVISDAKPEYVVKNITDTEAEIKRYEDAVASFEKKTQAMADTMRSQVGEHNAEILEGHILLLKDPGMEEITKSTIKGGTCAEAAFESACDMFIQMFQMTGDELLQQRVTDINDIRMRMLKILTGTPDVNVAEVPAGTVLVATDLTPSMTAGIVKENVVGILTEVGGQTSHSAILARALQIPAVLSINGIVSKVQNGMEVALDGVHGECILEPDEQQKNEYLIKRAEFIKQREMLQIYKGKETVTADGEKLMLFGNIGKPEDASQVFLNDGEGIGLFRTEFLFMGASKLPNEEEQFAAYKQAAEIMAGKSVIIRTLDVGGDKDIPYMKMDREDNPFMGFRAVRYCLENRELFKTQLRALLRANAEGNIRIMIPMVTCLQEIRDVRALMAECSDELKAEGKKFDPDVQIGIMVETPAAAATADILAGEADFFSIGTNDLTGYMMAADRGNAKVAYLYKTYQPAVLRMIRDVCSAAAKAGITVGMCGEAAADPALTPCLIAFGLDEFSVSPEKVLETRKNISLWSRDEAAAAVEKAMTLHTVEEIGQFLDSVKKEGGC